MAAEILIESAGPGLQKLTQWPVSLRYFKGHMDYAPLPETSPLVSRLDLQDNFMISAMPLWMQ